MDPKFVRIGAILAGIAVALGAFGTHRLRDSLPPNALQAWQAGVQYHLVHAIAILVVGAMGVRGSRARAAAGWLFTAGILVFGGSLYALALSGIRVLGAITPIGGVCFLAGWALLAISARAIESAD